MFAHGTRPAATPAEDVRGEVEDESEDREREGDAQALRRLATAMDFVFDAGADAGEGRGRSARLRSLGGLGASLDGARNLGRNGRSGASSRQVERERHEGQRVDAHRGVDAERGELSQGVSHGVSLSVFGSGE